MIEVNGVPWHGMDVFHGSVRACHGDIFDTWQPRV